MKYNPLLEPYKALVPFLAELLGESCEILLHDISQPKHSVIAIANGFHTGRKVGSPFTDLAIKIMEEKAYVKRDYLANYNGRSKNKNFVSSTFFIKHEGKVIGLLCINRNMDAMTELDLVLQKLKKAYNLEGALDDTDESMDTPVGDILPRMVASEMRAVGVPPERMTREEKGTVIRNLMNAGIHQMKGAVVEIARQLHLSRQCTAISSGKKGRTSKGFSKKTDPSRIFLLDRPVFLFFRGPTLERRRHGPKDPGSGRRGSWGRCRRVSSF